METGTRALDLVSSALPSPTPALRRAERPRCQQPSRPPQWPQRRLLPGCAAGGAVRGQPGERRSRGRPLGGDTQSPAARCLREGGAAARGGYRQRGGSRWRGGERRFEAALPGGRRLLRPSAGAAISSALQQGAAGSLGQSRRARLVCTEDTERRGNQILSEASTVCNYSHAGTKQMQGRCRGPHLADALCSTFMKPKVSPPLVT